MERILEGKEPAALLPVFRGRGVLPPAGQGEVAFAHLCRKAGEFAAKVLPYVASGKPEAVDATFDLDRFRFCGRLEEIYPVGLLRYRCANRKARDLLSLWVEHLTLCASESESKPRSSFLIAKDRICSFAPVHNADRHLASLLGLYLQGLSEPLPFFPESSLAFVTSGGDHAKALATWLGTEWKDGEGDDHSVSRCFGEADPEELIASQRFRELAEAVYSPLLAALGEGAP